jgi:phosphoribosyl 1,2-cyclic phosphodiesterase
MKICTLASSSSGNCTLVSHGNTHLLIDAGISLRRITACLKELGLTPGDLTGVLVTHEHSDHIGGIGCLSNTTARKSSRRQREEGIRKAMPELHCEISAFEVGTEFVLGEIAVRSFPTPHDTPESVGYRLTTGGKLLCSLPTSAA